MKVLKNLVISALFLSAGSAWAAPNESFESGLTNWSVVSPLTPVPTFVVTGPVGGVVPTNGGAMALYECDNCTVMPVLHYDFSTPLPLGLNDYVAIDVYSIGAGQRTMYLRLNDGTQWVTLGTNQTAQFEGGVCQEDGPVDDGRWEVLYSKAADDLAGVTITSVSQVEVLIASPLPSTALLYLDNLRVLTAGGGGICSGLETPTPIPTPSTPTTPNTPTTPTTPITPITPVDCGLVTCTFTETPTPTWTVTTTPTLTPTSTYTALPLMTFPNPIDFQELGPDSSGKTIDFQCHGNPPAPGDIPGNLFGCIKINGLERGTTLKIYTLSLSHVRTFLVNDTTAVFPAPDKNDYNRGDGTVGNPAYGQIVWDGTNENRNPVASGVYFYTYEGGTAGKVIGKFAIKRARK